MSLTKAKIINLTDETSFEVMFNPEEYTIEDSNSFAEIGIPGLEAPAIQYVRGNSRSLRMDLFFDTYEVPQKALKDVRIHTRKIIGLLDKNPQTKGPPILIFSWGRFQFKCVLDSVTQKFTMFLEDGRPVRATLSVSFKEYQLPADVEVRHGLFTGIPIVQNFVEGDTLSGLSGVFLGDPGKWREIAELNDIDNPRKIQSGFPLIIPSAEIKDKFEEFRDKVRRHAAELRSRLRD